MTPDDGTARLPFDDKEPSVRASDPNVSHDATASVPREHLRAAQRIVLNTFTLTRRPLSDEDLIDEVHRHFGATCLTDSSIRTRRRELERRGRVMVAGHATRAGRRCRTFKLAGGS